MIRVQSSSNLDGVTSSITCVVFGDDDAIAVKYMGPKLTGP